MRRGTKVGQAYVALTVDGSGINKDIADEFEGFDATKAGRDLKGRFLKGFTREDQEIADQIAADIASVDVSKMLDNIAKAFQNSDNISKGLRHNLTEAFNRGVLDDLLLEVGATLGKGIGDEFETTLKASILNSMEDAMEDVARRGGDAGSLLTSARGDSKVQLPTDTTDKIISEARKALAAQEKVYQEFDDRTVARAAQDEERLQAARKWVWTKAFDDQEIAEREFTKWAAGQAAERLAVETELSAFNRDRQIADDAALRRSAIASLSAQGDAYEEKAKEEKAWVDLLDKAYAMNHARRQMEIRKEAAEMGRAQSKATKEQERFWKLGDRFSFGKGSRFTPLHIMGTLMSGLLNTMGLLGRAAVGTFKIMVEGATQASKAFSEARAQGAAMVTALTQAGGAASASVLANLNPAGLITLAVAAVAAAAALAVIVPLVSIVGALTAALAAMGATIATSLVGGIAVASAGLAALIAAAGLATLAFRSMTDAQRELLNSAFRPVHQAAIGLGQIMITQMVPAFSQWADNIGRALALMQPLATVMGGAFASAGNILTRSLSGPGVQRFIEALSVHLPRIVTSLSTAFGRFGNGVAAVFAAILPYVTRFADYLARVGLEFTRWANSAKGQNSIADFMDRAIVSIQSLWGFIKSVGSLISEVFFSASGQNAGNSIFASMERAVRRFTNWLSQDNRLERWFADGVVIAQALGATIAWLADVIRGLYSSKVVEWIGDFVRGMTVLWDVATRVYNSFRSLPTAIQAIVAPIFAVAKAIDTLTGPLQRVIQLAGLAQQQSTKAMQMHTVANSAGLMTTATSWATSLQQQQQQAQQKAQMEAQMAQLNKTYASLSSSGSKALAGTSKAGGGYKAPKGPKKFKNPYLAFANELIRTNGEIARTVTDSIIEMRNKIADTLVEGAQAIGGDSVLSSFKSMAEQVRAAGAELVDAAKDGLVRSAQTLAGAQNKKQAKAALALVHLAQRDLSRTLEWQQRYNAAAARLEAQAVVTASNVAALVNGLWVQNATLGDFAEARAQVAEKITDATSKLGEAIQLRDEYAKQVAESTRTFASLTSAQAQTINGIEQALTANDITSNLQTRLDKIRTFQSNLRLLLASGLSNAAYQQIVDAGVEQGSAYAEALLAGGTGAISQTNALVGQIGAISDQLGTEVGSRMYQAGVNAAQGLLDGLTSLDAQLAAAALHLGNTIAAEIKRSLGIASPSRVLRAMMGDAGDGMVLGLDDQHKKVASAAGRLSSRVAVSPEVANYATRQGQAPVSGNNDQRPIELTVVTPTEDPVAVAHEAINELIGRL